LLITPALACAAEQRLGEFKPQELANTAWAFATTDWLDELQFAAVVRATKQRFGEFNMQELATTSWAFATVGHSDTPLLMSIATEAARALSGFQQVELCMTLWALSRRVSLTIAWRFAQVCKTCLLLLRHAMLWSVAHGTRTKRIIGPRSCTFKYMGRYFRLPWHQHEFRSSYKCC